MASLQPMLRPAQAVREVIYKRGFAKIDKQRVPITDNKVLGEDPHGILLS